MDREVANDESAASPESAVLTVREARRVLRLSHGAFYNGLANGSIPSIRIGRRYLIPRAALQALLDKACK
jgi:excisionase family DNA binding protein